MVVLFYLLKALLLFIGLIATTFIASADGFDSFGDQKILANRTIFAAGNISVFRQDSRVLSTPTAPQPTVYQIEQSCFVASDNYSGKAGLLLINRFGTVSLAILASSMSSVRVSSVDVSLVDCAEVSRQSGEQLLLELKRLREQIDMSIKQNEAMLELLKKQQSLKRAP